MSYYNYANGYPQTANNGYADQHYNNFNSYYPSSAPSYDPFYYQNQAPPSYQPSEQPRMYDLSLPPDPNSAAPKTDDDLLVEAFLAKIGKSSTKPEPKKRLTKRPLQIHIAKRSLRECLLILDKIQHRQAFLQLHAATMSTEEWNKHTQEIGELKDEFAKAIFPFEDKETMAMLKRAVEKRRKKRAGEKSKRRARKEELERVYEEREREHKRIDRWLEHGKEQAERAKMVSIYVHF